MRDFAIPESLLAARASAPSASPSSRKRNPWSGMSDAQRLERVLRTERYAGKFYRAFALGGIVIMFGEGLGTGRWLGNLYALCVPLGYACQILFVRKVQGAAGKAPDLLPTVLELLGIRAPAGLAGRSVTALLAVAVAVAARVQRTPLVVVAHVSPA